MLCRSAGECMIQNKRSSWGAIAASTQAILVQAPHGLPAAAPAWGSMVVRVWVIADPLQFGFRHCTMKCRPMVEMGH
jgi:hypothetical protein